MKTVVLGKIIENVYEVNHKWKQIEDNDGEIKTVYTDKPEIKKTTNVKEWKELCNFEGEPRYNRNHDFYSIKLSIASHGNCAHYLNISEDEEVGVIEEIFRADLNELHLRTGKIVKEFDKHKEEAEAIYEAQIKAFNKMMIESNCKLKSYCDLHKLSYEDTDCIALFELVFPDDIYEIVDGEMRVKHLKKCATIGTAIDGVIASTNHTHASSSCTSAITTASYAKVY